MDQTLVSVFLFASLTIISVSKAGIPLSLRCTSRPTFSTWSMSPPFLPVEPHLTFFHNLTPILPAPDCDVDDTAEPTDPKFTTIVILHKAHKDEDENVEINIKKGKNQSKDNQPSSQERNDGDVSAHSEIINENGSKQNEHVSNINEKPANKDSEIVAKDVSDPNGIVDETVSIQNEDISTINEEQVNKKSDNEEASSSSEDDKIIRNSEDDNSIVQIKNDNVLNNKKEEEKSPEEVENSSLDDKN